MSKKRVLLGSIVGSIVGVGLLVLSFYLSDLFAIPLLGLASIGGIGIGGFVAGLIATSPGKGALAGALTAVVTFIVSAITMVLLSIVVGQTLVTIIVGIASLGQVTPTLDPSALGLLIGVGLLVAGIVSVISAGLNAFTGFLGGLINNPKKSYADSYREVPETR